MLGRGAGRRLTVHNEVGGGRQETVVQVGYLERLTVRVGVGFRGLLVLLGFVLLAVRPDLPLPLPLPGRRAVSPVAAGWALLAVALSWQVVGRVQAVRRRRREAVWSSPAVLDRVAGELAGVLLSRYRDDERLRQADNPESIAVLWREVGGDRSRGDGDGDADGSVAQLGSLAAYFRGTPGRRLVLLGPAGAGKSVLAVRLARDLLAERQGAEGGSDPVPLVLHLASWNPGRGLDDWAAERLAAEYPEVCTPVPGAAPSVVAGRLVGAGRVLPVLDGFDELPAANRAAAFGELAALHSTRPFVLTSRPDQYRRQVPVDSDFLRSEVVLLPLSSAAVGQYLSAGGRRTRWRGLVERLADPGDRAREVVLLRQALDVPLMVGLARVAYGQDGTHPDALVRPGRFRTVEEVQGHLYTAYLDAVYSSSRSERALRGGRSPEEARRWAGFLAARMKAAGRTDLSWWNLDRDVPAPVRVLGLLPAFLLAWLLVSRADYGRPWWGGTVPLSVPGGFAVLTAGVLCLAVVSVTRERPDWQRVPRSFELPDGDALRRALRAARWKVGATALGLAAGWSAALARGSAGGYRLAGLATAVVLTVCTKSLFHHAWRPADTALAESPARLLARDRRAVLALGWLGPLGNKEASDDENRLQVVLPLFVVGFWQLTVGRDLVSAVDRGVLVVGSLLCWQLYAVGVSAWGRFAVARCWLALTGRLPLRLLDFLEDAHRRGVLRQSGGGYQFRHVELRDRLAADADSPADADGRDAPDAPDTSDAPVGPEGSAARAGGAWHARARGALAAVVFAGQCATGFGIVLADPDPWPVQAFPEPCSLLEERDLAWLTVDRVQYAHPPRDKDSVTTRTCTAAEQAPFAPDVRVTVSTVLFRSAGAEDRASEYAASVRRAAAALPSSVRDVDGLGGEAFFAVGDLMPRTGEEPYDRSTDLAPLPLRATAVIHRENALLFVSYAEEFASETRAVDVLRALLDRAAELAGPDWRRVGGEAPASLDAVPRSPAPERSNRFAYYHRDWRGTVRGASWGDGERSRVWHLGTLPFAFRGPRELDCESTTGLDDWELRHLDAYACGPLDAAHALGVAGPDVRIELAVVQCAGPCNDAEAKLLADRDRWEHAERLDWKRANSTTMYAERSDGGAPPGQGRYGMLLYRKIPLQRDDEPHSMLLWLRVEAPAAEEELVQKIVNDVHAQTLGGWDTTG
ncbi:NACHT domain-containing protein [Kitasatospora phosalacinea]|uniref:NACHT domain-containing protein n=1 Tax=Kitasatospora phosalacinea TaxID=2065 RepID=UPI0035E138E9